MNKIISTLLILLALASFNSNAQTIVYSGKHGYDALVHIDDNVIYKGKHGYDAMAHIDNDVIYKGKHGYDAIAHVDNGVIWCFQSDNI